MLLLLRKVRHKLLKSNRLITYLVYAIGEIILVVIGILIAVNLEQGFEEKRDQEKIRILLTQMYEELDDQILYYQRDSVELQSYINYLLLVSERKFDQVDLSSFIDQFSTWIGEGKEFDTALKGLIDQGIFDQIENSDLKRMILKDYMESQNNLQTALIWNSDVIVDTIEPFVNEHFEYKYRNKKIVTSEKQVLDLFESSQKFRSLIEFQLVNDDFVIEEISKHLDVMGRVRRELSLELNEE